MFMVFQDSPSPPPPGKTPDLPPVGAPKLKDKTVANASNVESNGLNDANTEKGSESSGDKKLDPGRSQDGKVLETFARENCKTNSVCNDQGKTIMACAQDFENGKSVSPVFAHLNNNCFYVYIIFVVAIRFRMGIDKLLKG